MLRLSTIFKYIIQQIYLLTLERFCDIINYKYKTFAREVHLMSDIQLPRKAYSLKQGEHEIDSYRYVVLIKKDNNRKEPILLYEEKLLKDSIMTNTFTMTENGKIFFIQDVLDFYRLYRKSTIANNVFWDSVKRKEELNLSDKDISELDKQNHQVLRDWYKNPVFISDKETKKYRDSYVVSRFDYSFDKLENFFINDFYNNMSITDFEINITNYFGANFDVEYLLQDNKGEKILFSHSGQKIITSFSNKTDFAFKYVCKNIYDVFFAVLHYCKLHGYKIKMCKLCHSLFIAENLKENYCHYPFSYINWENKEQTYPQCAEKDGARKLINDKLKCRKKIVYQRLYKRWEEYGMLEGDKSTKDLFEFDEKCREYERKIKENPNIDNFKEYEKFLYIDCDKIYKRYERRR